jgi:hypothetical protein
LIWESRKSPNARHRSFGSPAAGVRDTFLCSLHSMLTLLGNSAGLCTRCHRLSAADNAEQRHPFARNGNDCHRTQLRCFLVRS